MRWTGGGVNARRMSEVVPTVRPKQSSSPDQRAPDPGGTMPKQNVETPEPVLEAEVIYYAHDRFVCTQCSGITALYTGVTIGGAPVLPIEPRDVVAWVIAEQETGGTVGPLRCAGQHTHESGRAARKARVGQYVEFSGVAVSKK